MRPGGQPRALDAGTCGDLPPSPSLGSAGGRHLLMLWVRSQPQRAGAVAGLGAHSPGFPASTSSGGHLPPWGGPHPSLHPSPPAPLHMLIPPTSPQRLGWDLGVRAGCPQPTDAEVEAGAGSSAVREAWEGLQDRVGDAQRAEAGLWLSSQGALGVQEGPGTQQDT